MKRDGPPHALNNSQDLAHRANLPNAIDYRQAIENPRRPTIRFESCFQNCGDYRYSGAFDVNGWVGRSEKLPPRGSSSLANTDVLEKFGKQSQSIDPSRETKAAVRQSPIRA